jgi:hypothetical protein
MESRRIPTMRLEEENGGTFFRSRSQGTGLLPNILGTTEPEIAVPGVRGPREPVRGPPVERLIEPRPAAEHLLAPVVV